MHKLAVAEMIKSVRRRMAQGDRPTEPPFGREQLEDALVTLADMHELAAPGQLLGLLLPDGASLRERISSDPDVDTEAGLPMPPVRP